jgi:hypothetical protein
MGDKGMEGREWRAGEWRAGEWEAGEWEAGEWEAGEWRLKPGSCRWYLGRPPSRPALRETTNSNQGLTKGEPDALQALLSRFRFESVIPASMALTLRLEHLNLEDF